MPQPWTPTRDRCGPGRHALGAHRGVAQLSRRPRPPRSPRATPCTPHPGLGQVLTGDGGVDRSACMHLATPGTHLAHAWHTHACTHSHSHIHTHVLTHTSHTLALTRTHSHTRTYLHMARTHVLGRAQVGATLERGARSHPPALLPPGPSVPSAGRSESPRRQGHREGSPPEQGHWLRILGLLHTQKEDGGPLLHPV